MSSASAPAPALDKNAMFREHNLSEEEFRNAKIDWDTLLSIREHHWNARGELQTTGEAIAQCLQPVPEVHSLRIRVKSPNGLVAKIIRKRSENADFPAITAENYTTHITDLIGVRALHLFKNDWLPIHEFIKAHLYLHEETPTAYVRDGDPPEMLEAFRKAGCEVKEHQYNYRSIHYLLKSQPFKHVHITELQVRTLFEEGWAEIDHQLRYPRRSEDPSLAMFLAIFNRTAGSADEMGTFAKALSIAVTEQQAKLAEVQEKLDKLVSKLDLTQAEKAELQKQIQELKKSSASLPIAVGRLDPAVMKHAFSDLIVSSDILKGLGSVSSTLAGLASLRICSSCSYANVGGADKCAQCGRPL